MHARMFHTLVFLLVATLAAPAVRADDETKPKKGKKDKGRFEPQGAQTNQLNFLKEHASELKITAEQMKKLEALKEDYEKKLVKLKNDPNIKDMYMRLMQANEAREMDEVRSIQKQLREETEKKTGITPKDVLQQVSLILTRQQLQDLEKLRRENGMGGPMAMKGERGERGKKDDKDSKDDPSRRPDPNKGAPKIYEE